MTTPSGGSRIPPTGGPDGGGRGGGDKKGKKKQGERTGEVDPMPGLPESVINVIKPGPIGPKKIIPPNVISPTAIRLNLFNKLTIPTSGVMALSEIALYALQHYAMFVWLVDHQASRFSDGLSEGEIANLVSGSETIVNDLKAKGPASIFLALNGGYKSNIVTTTYATHRLLLLAMLADRPALIPTILRAFPEVGDRLQLAALLQPFTDSRLDDYSKDYAVPPRAADAKIGAVSTSFSPNASILSNLPKHGILRALAALGRLRIMQNLVLRNAIRVRYAMISVMADPHVFGPSSLGEMSALMAEIDNTVTSSPNLYIPIAGTIEMLKRNFEVVSGLLAQGAAISADSIRRLRLMLGVLNASDTLFDKIAGPPEPGAIDTSANSISDAELAKYLTPDIV